MSQAAQLFSVSAATLRRWDESGYLRAMRVGPKKIRKYYREDVAYRLMEMGFIQ